MKFYGRNIHAPFIHNLKYFEWNKTRLNFKQENYRMSSQLRTLRVLMKMKKNRADKTNRSSIRWRIWYRSRLPTVAVRWVKKIHTQVRVGFNKKRLRIQIKRIPIQYTSYRKCLLRRSMILSKQIRRLMELRERILLFLFGNIYSCERYQNVKYIKPVQYRIFIMY